MATATALMPHFALLSFDWLVFLGLIIVLTLIGLMGGTSRPTALALALPTAALLFSKIGTFAFLAPVGKLSGFALAAAFLVLLAILYLLISRMTRSFSDQGGFVLALLSGLATTIVVVVLWPSIPALHPLWHMGAALSGVFVAAYQLYWLIVAYIVLAYVRS